MAPLLCRMYSDGSAPMEGILFPVGGAPRPSPVPIGGVKACVVKQHEAVEELVAWSIALSSSHRHHQGAARIRRWGGGGGDYSTTSS